MFLQIIDLTPYIIINQPIPQDAEYFDFVILSKYTNTPFPQGSYAIPALWIETNERFTRFELQMTEFWLNNPEANGIFSYRLELEGNVIDSGLVKVVSASPENNTYISNNDDREAIVYFEN